MPSPDIEYCLQGSLECGHITLDTYNYWHDLAPDPDAEIDRIFEAHRRRPETSPVDYLSAAGLALESRYIEIRAADRGTASAISMGALPFFRTGFAGFVAQELPALFECHPVEAEITVGRLKRYARRLAADVLGRSVTEIVDVMSEQRRQQEERRRIRQATLIQQYRDHEDLWDDTGSRWSRNRPTSGALSAMKRERKARQRAISRSIRFAQKIIGADVTRMFVRGDRVRFEGNLADYEVTRIGRFDRVHGQYRLSVFKKQTDVHLCDLCLYSDGVPLMDHIATIAMYIRADQEEEILKTGNALSISPAGRREDWLQPYLPEPVSRSAVTLDELRLPVPGGDDLVLQLGLQSPTIQRSSEIARRTMRSLIRAVPEITDLMALSRQVCRLTHPDLLADIPVPGCGPAEDVHLIEAA
jgi:hypothetical protein